MKCKSCGAQYPDNASFCPDCGEKNDSYVQQQPAGTASADFNPQPVQNNYQPQYGNQQYYGGQPQYNPAPANSGNVKKKAKAAGKNIVMRIVISVVVFGIASAVSALYYSNKKSSGDAHATEYEQLAVDYVANLTGNADAYAFRNASAIDFAIDTREVSEDKLLVPMILFAPAA